MPEKPIDPTVIRDPALAGSDADASFSTDESIFVSNNIGSDVNADAPTLDRYRIVQPIGRGGFGTVYLAIDDTLNRQVAVKFPHADRISNDLEIDLFLNEAQTLAGIDHPNVLTIYDFGKNENGRCYTVSKYIDGPTMADLLNDRERSLSDNIGVLATVLQALGAVHEEGIVHRDVKPHNVLIDSAGQPYLSDFGLALRDEQPDALRQVGTLKYMCPEQCRGESHLVDGRADIYAVGVILYVMLTGRFPFDGSNTHDIVEKIICGDPRPPRQVDRAIPQELERICLKSLSQRASDRYTTAYDFSNELLRWVTDEAANVETQFSGGDSTGENTALFPHLGTSTDTIVPRGLRCFGQRDANFFLKLLPGPRGKSGLPDAVDHWKDWVENTTVESTSRIGVIYGPSGCGKSSLLNAGLIPRLSRATAVVSVEASRDNTDDVLKQALEGLLTSYHHNRTLSDIAADIRSGRGLSGEKQVVVIVDQLEQWLASNKPFETSEFAGLLRQCDGKRLKAILIVRDEFWLALSRLLAFTEVPFQTGVNAVFVDLFDTRHARRVLHEYGYAYNRLPSIETELSADQDRFLSLAISNLATDGAVYPVRIAVFAEMMKSREWSAATLKLYGGAEGIGVRFLEETFDSESTPERYRQHAAAAANLLSYLLPENTSEIRGNAATLAELRSHSGYEDDEQSFAELVNILDQELRLISVTREQRPASDADTAKDDDVQPKELRDDSKYLLAHDYLIPSIRMWLRRRRSDSFRGRTLQNFEDSLATWKSDRSSKTLPWFADWVRFRLFLRGSLMSDDGQSMMRQANVFHGLRLVVLAVVIASVGFFWLASHRHAEVESMARQLQAASVANLPELTAKASPRADAVLSQLNSFENRDDRSTLAVDTARVALGGEVADWVDRVLDAAPEERRIVSTLDVMDDQDVVNTFREVVLDKGRPASQRLAAAQVVALRSETLDAEVEATLTGDSDLVDALVQERQNIAEWATAFEPFAELLLPRLSNLATSEQRTPESVTASDYLLLWCDDNPSRSFEHLLAPTPWQSDEFNRLGRKHAMANVSRLNRLVGRVVEAIEASNSVSDIDCRRAGMAVALLAELKIVEDLYRVLQVYSDPRLRVEAIYQLSQSMTSDEVIHGWLRLAIANSDPGSEAALLKLLALRAEPSNAKLGSPIGETVIGRFRASDDAEVHSAAEACLVGWGALEPSFLRTDQPLGTDERKWRVNGQGQTLIRIGGPRVSDAQSSQNLPLLEDYDLEVLNGEVTVGQIHAFDPSSYIHYETSPTNRHPANVVTFSKAINYCRWLTEVEGMGEDEQCYPHADTPLPNDWAPFPDHRTRRGYRLPNVDEWEFVARAGVRHEFRFPTGNDPRRLIDYEQVNQLDAAGAGAVAVGQRLPNRFGLFSLVGNQLEWAIDAKERQRYGLGATYRSPFSVCTLEVDTLGTMAPETEYNTVGFRVVRTVPKATR